MHTQVVLVLEPQSTALAIVLIVSQCIHMLICRVLGVEFLLTCLTGDPRGPMSNGRHMLVRCILRAKVPCARLAFEAWCPVIGVVHMLVARLLSTEGTGTRLAFGPVVIFVHMVVAVILAPEGTGASLAFVHLGWK